MIFSFVWRMGEMGEADVDGPMQALSGDGEEKILVSVRLRPLNEKEIARNDVSDWESINGDTVIYRNNLSVSERSVYPTAYTFGKKLLTTFLLLFWISSLIASALLLFRWHHKWLIRLSWSDRTSSHLLSSIDVHITLFSSKIANVLLEPCYNFGLFYMAFSFIMFLCSCLRIFYSDSFQSFGLDFFSFAFPTTLWSCWICIHAFLLHVHYRCP